MWKTPARALVWLQQAETRKENFSFKIEETVRLQQLVVSSVKSLVTTQGSKNYTIFLKSKKANGWTKMGNYRRHQVLYPI